jgi:hypothetical protein
MTASSFDQILELALRLPPKERLQLAEQVISSVEQEFEPKQAEGEHWGQKLLLLVEELDMSDWTDIEIDDPVEWVKHIRQEQEKHRGLNWEQDE